MVKRFFILFTAYFLLVFPIATHADVVVDEPIVVIEDSWFGDMPWLLVIILIGALLVATVALIRVFWKPNKDKKSD